LQLDDWVLCRIYNKKGTIEKQNAAMQQPPQQPLPQPPVSATYFPGEEDKKPEIFSHRTTYAHFDTNSDSVPPPRLHTESTTSCSEHVVSPSEFTCDREVQSEPKWKEMEFQKTLDFPYNYVDATMDTAFASQFQGAAAANQMSPLQDMFMFLQKPF